MGLREEKKAEQRRAILDAAVALFRRRGYGRTRVQDIIARLRISEATFFNYFPAKDALLDAFAEEQLDETAVNLAMLLNQKDLPVPDRIRGLMRLWALGLSADRKFSEIMTARSQLLSAPQGILREKVLRNYQLFERLFAEGQRRGEIRRDAQPRQLAEMLEGIFTITAGNWLVGWWKDESEALEPRLMHAVEVFLDGCKPHKPAGPSRRKT
ncbi:MAG: TetR/AcrR family transcriptional regulator [Deltaproteobacteria bacterium]|nr:TetR/AcrR family transcriptional regulator [Deltaproteobacteria bacterium]